MLTDSGAGVRAAADAAAGAAPPVAAADGARGGAGARSTWPARRLDLSRDPRASAIDVRQAAVLRQRWANLPGPRGAPTARSDGAEAPPDEPVDLPADPATDIPEDSYAGRLLAARKAARKKIDRDPG